MKLQIPPRVLVILAIVSFLVAAVPSLGLVMKSDLVGRIIFAAVWILLGIVWLGLFLHVKKSPPH